MVSESSGFPYSSAFVPLHRRVRSSDAVTPPLPFLPLIGVESTYLYAHLLRIKPALLRVPSRSSSGTSNLRAILRRSFPRRTWPHYRRKTSRIFSADGATTNSCRVSSRMRSMRVTPAVQASIFVFMPLRNVSTFLFAAQHSALLWLPRQRIYKSLA